MNASETSASSDPEEPIAVLHVDDDPQATDLVRRHLERLGDRFDVTETNDPERALALFDANRFECVLSDFRMPDLDGLELLAEIRDRDAHLPFILMTGRGSESVASEAIAAGVTDYVTKGRAADTYETLANRIENAVESHRVREALAESEQRFREVAETIEEVVWLADPTTGETHYVNPAYEDVWGRPVEDLESDRTAFLDGIHPDDRDRVRTALESMATGYQEVYRVVQPDGEVRWVEDSGVPIRDADGTVDRIVGVAKDITRYKEAVRERELLLERITDGFVSVDDADRLTYLNERAATLLDADPDALVGRNIWDVIPEMTETSFYEAHREAVETGDARSVEAHVESLGRWFQAYIYPAADGVSTIVRDVTERHERERRLEAIFENTYQFTGLLDLDGRFLEVNESMLDEADPESVVGSTMDEAFDVTPESADRIETGIERARNGRFYRSELAFTSDGRDRVADFSIRPIRTESGAIAELLVEARDVTKRKRREELREALTAISEDILRASTSLEVHEIAVAAATDVFDRPEARSYALRPDENRLETVASWTEPGTPPRPVRDRSLASIAWRTFAEQSVRYEPSLGDPSVRADDSSPRGESPLGDGSATSSGSVPDPALDSESAVFVPLGDHGVLVVGDPIEDGFSPIDVDLLELLGTLITAALDRASGQSAIVERDRALERVSDDVSRLELQTHLTRETLRAVERADTRPDLERSVCEFLTALDAFEGAWVGTYDPVAETTTPSVWRGMPDRYVEGDDASLAERHRDLLDRAIERESAQVVDDVLDAVDRPSVRRAAMRYGCRTVVAVPFRADPVAGGLVCFGGSPGVFTDELVTILEEVGATVGGAIRSIERSRALASGTELAVDLDLSDPDGLYQRLASGVDGTIELQGAAASGGRLTQFVSIEPVDGNAADASAAESSESAAVRSAEDGTAAGVDVDADAAWLDSLDAMPGTAEVLAAGGGRALVRLETADETVLEPLRDVGGTIRALSATPDRVRVRVRVPHGTDVRALVEAYRRRYASVDLRARRETESDDDGPSLVGTAALDRLTDRQREAFLLAYHAGYFESPRQMTGGELADLMDVSSPTFHDHLRSAQARLFEAVLEPPG
ncbi:PAS domain S-box protein [Halovivax limisalsi]|uniref:PAS domain S-box protein n=1 Tax=Halovivax limisalsi TaxID=1453760 RepID=UPI001FFD477E|nr:PAS domain S-box protein [Halovivax limisalsi]